MRTLSIDLGTKRIGLALSDEGGKLATPYDVLNVSSPQHAIEPIRAVIRKEGVQQLVIGLPLNMDNSFGPAAHSTVQWASLLNEQANLPMIFVDERLSSFDAEQRLTDRKRGGEKITRQDKERQLDALAAAAFLQEFLDGKLPPIEVSSDDD